MSYALDRGLGYPNSVKPETLGDLAEEIVRARDKFPNADCLFPALVEKFGELADAIVNDKGLDRKECLQIACVALRLYEEGDPKLDHADVRGLAVYVALLESRARAALANVVGPAAAARSAPDGAA